MSPREGSVPRRPRASRSKAKPQGPTRSSAAARQSRSDASRPAARAEVRSVTASHPAGDSETGGRPFLVFELHPEEAHEAPSPWARPKSRVPVRCGATLIGCFFAADRDEACKSAARSENRLGYFVAVETSLPKLDFETSDYSSAEREWFIEREAPQERES